MSDDALVADAASPAASILGWRYEYRFLAPDRVDIDVHLTFGKEDDTPIVVGASLFAAGNTTPSGVVDSPAGVYDVMLPIRNFRCIPWTPHTVEGGAQKRYLLNMKLTTVPESEFDEPEVLAFLGGIIGFRAPDVPRPIAANAWVPQPEDSDESTARARLIAARETGIDLLLTPAGESDAFYSLCDELGMLVVQIFLPDETPPAEIRRLQHHPSVAYWADGGDDLQNFLPMLGAPDSEAFVADVSVYPL